MLKKMSTVLSIGMLLSTSFVSANAGTSAEDVCFKNLVSEAKKSSVFSSIDFEKLTKINGAAGDTVSSGEFSSASYDDFKKYAKLAVPKSKSFLPKFPEDVNSVPNDYLDRIPPVYKQNRTNVAFLLGDDNRNTAIGDPNKDGQPDHINGYYVDSKILTFGNKSDLIFPFPSRKATPEQGKAYPFGKPYVDMREYVIFSQHLSAQFGGKFIGCGVAKMEPQGEYALASWNGEKSISPFYYGGQVMQGSDIKTKVLPVKDGHKFRATDVRTQTNAKEEIEGEIFYNNPLMKYKVLVLGYDNGSNFYNEFVTHQIFTEIFSKPAYSTKNVDWVVERVIEALKSQTNLGVLAGVSVSAFNPSEKLFASIIDTVKAEEEPYVWGGVAVGEGVNFKTIEKINKIEDESLKIMLKTSITPGYYEYFAAKPEEKRNEFEKNYLKQPLSFEEKLENVNYLLDNAEDISKLSPDNLKFKDIKFGGSVIPVTDKRVKEVLNRSYLKDEEKALLVEKKEKLAKLILSDDMNAIERQKIINQREDLEREYISKISKLYTFEDQFKEFKVDYLDLKVQKEQGRITTDEFDLAVKELHQGFEKKANRVQMKNVLTKETIKKVSDDLLEKKPLFKNEEIKSQNLPFSKYIYIGVSLLLLAFGIMLGLFGFKTLKRKGNIM